jgi:hypothetical protein
MPPREIPYFHRSPEDDVRAMFEKIIVFAIIWSFGGILNTESRAQFERFMRMHFRESRAQLPQQETIFDYWVDLSVGLGEWCLWTDGKTGNHVEVGQPLESQFISSSANAPVFFFTRLMLSNCENVLLHGPSSSKTLIVNTLFNHYFDSRKFDCRVLPLSNCSNPTAISRFVQGHMHKRQHNYSALKGKSMLFFLDNLGAVKPEMYGAQPALELLRQYFDYGGWFNTATVEFTGIMNTTIVAAMGTPGGGLFDIPDRLRRRFFTLHFPRYRTTKPILIGLLTLHFEKFGKFALDLIDPVVDASTDIFKDCIRQILPIQSKLLYVFDLRDLVKVFTGMLLSVSSDITITPQFVRLWWHEMMRVFYDRFNTATDRTWFQQRLTAVIPKYLKLSWESIRGDRPSIMFNAFSNQTARYQEVIITPVDELALCNQCLENHNREQSKQLDIVLFSEAVDHLSSLARILLLPKGHAMLVQP